MAFEAVTVDSLKRQLAATEVRGIALDVDDTLCFTNVAWYTWMGQNFGWPERADLRDLMNTYRGAHLVPYWQSPEALKACRDLVDNGPFYTTLKPIDGVPALLHELNKFVPIVAYITARPTLVAPFTAQWLGDHGFPDAAIVTRPDETPFEEMFGWKARTLMGLYPEVAGIVDDQPDLSIQLAELGYPGIHYLYDNGSNDKQYDHELTYRDWSDLVTAIREGA